MRTFILSLLGVMCLFGIGILSGCGGDGGDDNEANNPGAAGACSTLGLKVIGGEGCRTRGSPIAAIVTQVSPGLYELCSGTLIAPNQILTAAHCFEGTPIDSGVAVGTDIYQIESVVRHPRYSPDLPGAPFDIAVMTLSASIDVSPVPIYTSKVVAAGEKFTAFGFGSDEFGNTALDEGRNESLKAANMIASENFDSVFLGDFDSTNTSVCTGDSGGPAIQEINGVGGVVGVISFDIAGCGKGSSSGFGAVANSDNARFLRQAAPKATFR